MTYVYSANYFQTKIVSIRHFSGTLISLINVGLQINVGSGKYQNLINEGSGTNGVPGIFVTLYKEVFENSHFFRFSTKFSMIFFKNR